MGRSWGDSTARRREVQFFPSSGGAFVPSSPRRGGAKRRGGQVWPVGNANIGDPVTRSARETRFNIFTFEVSRGPAKPCWVYILEHVDVDDRIEMVRDLARDQRHGAAPRADVKRGCPSPEGVLRHERGITNSDRQPRTWVRSPDASVLDAEGATARARRNLGRVSLPLELEGDVAAVASTFDEHVAIDAGRFSSALPPWLYTPRQRGQDSDENETLIS